MFLCVPFTVIMMIVCAYFPATRPVAILLSGNGQLTSAARRRRTLLPSVKRVRLSFRLWHILDRAAHDSLAKVL